MGNINQSINKKLINQKDLYNVSNYISRIVIRMHRKKCIEKLFKLKIKNITYRLLEEAL